MLYKQFQNLQLSALGFGAMRLPLLPDGSGTIDQAELAVLEKIAADMQGKIPCTGCRYCCAGCPVGLNIPMILNMANEMQVYSSMNLMMRYSALGDGKRAADCIACGQCREACPQKIDVPAEMAKFAEVISTQKTWEETCRERAAAAAKT